MRTVFLVDLRHEGLLPRAVRDILDLMDWTTVRPGIAYLIDWDEAIDSPMPPWDRIELLMRAARLVGLRHRMLTLRRGQKIPLRGM